LEPYYQAKFKNIGNQQLEYNKLFDKLGDNSNASEIISREINAYYNFKHPQPKRRDASNFLGYENYVEKTKWPPLGATKASGGGKRRKKTNNKSKKTRLSRHRRSRRR
jgi:hypothetical protein